MTDQVTIGDVATAAGVAVGTVSRVLNKHTNVSPEVRERVFSAVAELNYKPIRRHGRKELRSKTDNQESKNLGVLILGLDSSLVHMPLVTETLHGVEAAIRSGNHNLLLSNIPLGDKVPSFIQNKQIDGLIIKGSYYGKLSDHVSKSFEKKILKYPTVWVLGEPEDVPGDKCSFNAEMVARLAARHLKEKGHKRIAFINPKEGKNSLDVLKVFFDLACRKLGLHVQFFESNRENGSAWPEQAIKETADIAHLVKSWENIREDERATAIFTPGYSVAIQLDRLLSQKNYTIGKDISIISCSNEKPYYHGDMPELTTIDINAEKIGICAVEQLLWRINHPKDKNYRKILLEPTLLQGNSVAQL